MKGRTTKEGFDHLGVVRESMGDLSLGEGWGIGAFGASSASIWSVAWSF